jgi:hypothetical protein
VEKVAIARRAGAQGVVLFSHESFAPDGLRELGRQAFGARLVAVPASGAGGSVAGSR